MYKDYIGFGIAGNFAHHLEQAGEIVDFVDVEVKDENAPKGMFPFYLPNHPNSFLSTYPLSSNQIVFPTHDDNLQLEPEVVLICEITYDKNNNVTTLSPTGFAAYNDCSIRKQGAKKISEKKNWGINTKGISEQVIKIDNLDNGGVLDDYHIASYVKRDGVFHEYGEDSAAVTYNYFHKQLLDWIVEKLNEQQDAGPLENLSEHLKSCNYPRNVVISIGATSYTDFGENNFLEKGDEVFVVLYNNKITDGKNIKNLLENETIKNESGISLLHQKIV